MNTALLEDEEYIYCIEKFLHDWIERLPTWSSIQLWWVEGKRRIIALTREYSIQQAHLRKQMITTLNSLPF